MKELCVSVRELLCFSERALCFSERADPNYHEDYKGRITEGANINKSLNTLGNVIKALGECCQASDEGPLPFQDQVF